MSGKGRKRGMSLLWKIGIGFVLGIVLGFTVGPSVAGTPVLKDFVMPALDVIGKIFLTLLKMLIVPLVFASLVAGSASVGDPRKLGRIGAKTLVLYLLTTAVAIVIGLALGNLIRPGVGMNIEGVTAAAKEAKPSTSTAVAPPCSSPAGWVFPVTGMEPTTSAALARVISMPSFSCSEEGGSAVVSIMAVSLAQ